MIKVLFKTLKSIPRAHILTMVESFFREYAGTAITAPDTMVTGALVIGFPRYVSYF